MVGNNGIVIVDADSIFLCPVSENLNDVKGTYEEIYGFWICGDKGTVLHYNGKE